MDFASGGGPITTSAPHIAGRTPDLTPLRAPRDGCRPGSSGMTPVVDLRNAMFGMYMKIDIVEKIKPIDEPRQTTLVLE